ncbi:MAG: EamA family transporter [Leptolinea sp.]|jgi:drug/metabolite transporter (DMT)-like permease|nr:EamA family transporter [Leptolinea sp.]
MKQNKLQPGILALIGCVSIWGSTFVITKSLMNSIGPFMIIGLRLMISLVVITPIALRRGFVWKMILQKDYLLFGLTGVALYFGLANTGLDLTTAANAALIQAANPAAVALLSVLVLKEQITPKKGIGIGLSIIGVLLVAGIPASNQGATLAGNLLMVGSVIAWAVYTVQSRKIPSSVDALASTTASFYTGLIWLVPFIAWEFTHIGLPVISPSSWLALVYLGLVASGLAYFLWNYALNSVEASVAAPFINLIPIIGLTLSLLVGESVTFIQIFGGLVAILGVLITQNIPIPGRGSLHENPDPTH